MSYKYHSDEALETIARKVISQHDPSLLDKPTAIPVDDIIEMTYGLTLEFQFIRNNGRILGETVFADAVVPIYDRADSMGYKLITVCAGTVIIDATLLHKRNSGRFRFTCAHELAHWVIDKDYFVQLGETAAMTERTAKSSQVDEMIERQANRMASRILMPKCTLKKAFYRTNGTAENIITNLATVYDVSQQAMEIRLQEMGLLQQYR